MRGLDDLEFEFLERAIQRADGHPLEWIDNNDNERAIIRTLIARGLGVVGRAEDEEGPFTFLAPTPLGRIALRVERLIRSGGALKTA